MLLLFVLKPLNLEMHFLVLTIYRIFYEAKPLTAALQREAAVQVFVAKLSFLSPSATPLLPVAVPSASIRSYK